MHWFWRAVIALGIGVQLAAPIRGMITIWFVSLMQQPMGPGSQALHGALGIGAFGVGIGTVALSTVAVYMFLGWLMESQAAGRHTRCRKCNYILRGITEPRCPECGERI